MRYFSEDIVVSSSVGVVIPAYQPDFHRLDTYIDALRSTGLIDRIRLEIDVPTESVTSRELGVDSLNISSERRGKGAAIMAGFEALSTDIVAFADADGATPASSFAEILQTVQEGLCDLAIGSRRHPQATVQTHQTFLRRRLGDAFAWLARQSLPLSLYDYQCGAKAMTARTWEHVRSHLYETGFAWDLELIAMAHTLGHSIREVPITWHDTADSTVDPLREPFRMGMALLAINHRIKALEGHSLHQVLRDVHDQQPLVVRSSEE